MICNPSYGLETSRSVSVKGRVLTESKSAGQRRKNEGKGDANKEGEKGKGKREKRMKKEILHGGGKKGEREEGGAVNLSRDS